MSKIENNLLVEIRISTRHGIKRPVLQAHITCGKFYKKLDDVRISSIKNRLKAVDISGLDLSGFVDKDRLHFVAEVLHCDGVEDVKYFYDTIVSRRHLNHTPYQEIKEKVRP